jgi:hypothetical protein
LPESTKQNLIVSINSPDTLSGIMEVFESDWIILGQDMDKAVNHYVNGK